MKHVVIGMSGGVDSSVAAIRLLDSGYQVTGIMLRLWTDGELAEENQCCTEESMSLAKQIAGLLGIPFYVIDAKDLFHSKIVQYFVDGYQNGITPNPCVMCNKVIRWGFLLETAKALGANYLGTGHYARVQEDAPGHFQLLCGVDREKDQSYVLSLLNQDQLSRTILPIGELYKYEVRDMARKHQLPVAERQDSQDLCFLGGGDYRGFLRRQSKGRRAPGEIVNRRREVLGRHEGLEGFTIGQRKGLKISSDLPLYVIEIDREQNQLIVGSELELAGRSTFFVKGVNWISNKNQDDEMAVLVKIRYRSEFHPAVIRFQGQQVEVILKSPVRDITPGQLAVFYSDDSVLGGGMITDSRVSEGISP